MEMRMHQNHGDENASKSWRWECINIIKKSRKRKAERGYQPFWNCKRNQCSTATTLNWRNSTRSCRTYEEGFTSNPNLWWSFGPWAWGPYYYFL